VLLNILLPLLFDLLEVRIFILLILASFPISEDYNIYIWTWPKKS
jgi:hypothetical protein